MIFFCFFFLKIDRNMLFVFFFQAEDGIRDWSVTGVQTCALPIFEQSLHVGAQGAREAPDLGAETCLLDQLDRAAILRRHARKPCLDPVDPKVVEPVSDLELLLGIEHDPDRLFAVAKRGVVQANGAADRDLVVDVPGPDRRIAHPTASPSATADSTSRAIVTAYMTIRRNLKPSQR